MIRSDKELAISRRKMHEAEEAAGKAEGAARVSLQRLADEMRSEVQGFQAVRSGMVTSFNIRGFDDLGDALIKARIAKGWTQRQLAEALDVSQQQVQKQESRSYEGASTTRLAEVAEVLEYELQGVLAPIGSDTSPQKVGSFAFPAGQVEVQALDDSLLDQPQPLRMHFHVRNSIPDGLTSVMANVNHVLLKRSFNPSSGPLALRILASEVNEPSCD